MPDLNKYVKRGELEITVRPDGSWRAENAPNGDNTGLGDWHEATVSLPPIKRTRKPKADPPALKTNAKSLGAVAEMRERYLAAGGKGRIEIRALLAPDGELTATEILAIVKTTEPLTDSDAALLDMIFDAIDAAAGIK